MNVPIFCPFLCAHILLTLVDYKPEWGVLEEGRFFFVCVCDFEAVHGSKTMRIAREAVVGYPSFA